MLNDVDWETLSNQLNLGHQVAAIDALCRMIKDIKSCCLREMILRYIQSQHVESCDNTRRKIAKALDDLGYVKEASLLRQREWLMCFGYISVPLCIVIYTGPIKI